MRMLKDILGQYIQRCVCERDDYWVADEKRVNSAHSAILKLFKDAWSDITEDYDENNTN